jgi:protein SCO1
MTPPGTSSVMSGSSPSRSVGGRGDGYRDTPCVVGVNTVTRRAFAAVAIVLLSVSTLWAASPRFRSGVLDPPRLAPEIVLPAHDGTDFRLSRHRGDVVAITFGFTFCPDVCPTTLAELAQVRAKLGPAAKRLRVVFVTVDPERDGPERLRAYTHAFDRTFVGLTGSPEQLAAVQRAYGPAHHRGGAPATTRLAPTALARDRPAGQLREASWLFRRTRVPTRRLGPSGVPSGTADFLRGETLMTARRRMRGVLS